MQQPEDEQRPGSGDGITRSRNRLATPGSGSTRLKLADFLPYKLSVVSNRVSALIADAYSERFDLRIPEWRVIAVLGEAPGLTATQVAARTAMDKVAVTRAVQGLVRKGRVKREASQTDGRVTHLVLTASGKRVYAQIAPVALGYEDAIAGMLSRRERDSLARILGKLAARLDELEGETG